MEHGHKDTKTISDLFKLLTSTLNTVLHTAWPRITAVPQRAVAAPKGAVPPCIEWLMLATILKIADAMGDLIVEPYAMEHTRQLVWIILHAVLV